MPESISFDKDLKDAIKNSVSKLSKAVKSTLGPAGTNVMVLSEIGLPIIVNDGVTVAKKVKFEDPLENHIANILKTVSKNTDSVAGDGTTTATTLAEAIILNGIKNIEAGFSAVNISKGIHQATKLILQELEKNSLSVLDNKNRLLQVASISANNDKVLGKIISDAFLKVGVDGQIEVKDSTNEKTYIEIVNGMKYNTGFESNMFVNTDKTEVLLNDCKILIYEGKLKTIDPIVTVLRDIRNENKSLLVIADDFTEEAINDLAHNKINAKLKVCAVKSPGFGIAKENNLDDISSVTDSQIISKRFGRNIDSVDLTLLGSATTVKVDSDSFVIIGEAADKKETENKISLLKIKLKQSKGETEKTEISERIAKLSNGVAILHVSGASSVEIAEKKYRIEDAIHATRASLEEGIVPGGGVTLLKLGKALEMPKMDNQSQEIGFKILLDALEAPIKTICSNADESGDVIINEILKGKFNFGYDAKTKKYKDLIKAGIVDPKKVTRTALQNASSVAQMILTLNCAIY